jgi:hypothetical protein
MPGNYRVAAQLVASRVVLSLRVSRLDGVNVVSLTRRCAALYPPGMFHVNISVRGRADPRRRTHTAAGRIRYVTRNRTRDLLAPTTVPAIITLPSVANSINLTSF